MTSTTKTGVVLVIILAILVCGIIWSKGSDDNYKVSLDQELATPLPVQKLPNTAGTGMSDINDDSEEGIQVDLDAIEKQITGLNGDAAGIDYGINNINK